MLFSNLVILLRLANSRVMCVHSLSAMEGADFLQVPADVINFGLDAANGSKCMVWQNLLCPSRCI